MLLTINVVLFSYIKRELITPGWFALFAVFSCGFSFFSRILMPFFGFEDCCGLQKWTYFWHGFQLYLMGGVAVKASLYFTGKILILMLFLGFEKARFADIPHFIVARSLLIFTYILLFAVCISELQRTIIEPCPNEQSQWKIDIFLYVWYIYFNIESSNGCRTWERLPCSYRLLVRNRQSLTRIVSAWGKCILLYLVC